MIIICKDLREFHGLVKTTGLNMFHFIFINFFWILLHQASINEYLHEAEPVRLSTLQSRKNALLLDYLLNYFLGRVSLRIFYVLRPISNIVTLKLWSALIKMLTLIEAILSTILTLLVFNICVLPSIIEKCARLKINTHMLMKNIRQLGQLLQIPPRSVQIIRTIVPHININCISLADFSANYSLNHDLVSFQRILFPR